MYYHLVLASVLLTLCEGSQNYAAPPIPVDSKTVISPYSYKVNSEGSNDMNKVLVGAFLFLSFLDPALVSAPAEMSLRQ